MSNPLLDMRGLPLFSRIRPEHVEPAVDQVLADNRACIIELLQPDREHSWEALVVPLEALEHRLARTWSPVSHLNAVANVEALRAAYNTCQAKLSAYATEVGQNESLYRALRSIADSPAYYGLSTAQKRVVDNALRDFRLSGVHLEPSDKARFKTIQQKLSRLTTRFSENLLDATQAWHRHIEDPSMLSGLPESAVGTALEAAQARELPGWVITLDYPAYAAVISYAEHRELRREVYEAYVTRASDRGPNAGRWDNSEIMEEILRLRHELAQLLGYGSYAERSLATKMAESPEQVMRFLSELAERSMTQARQELEELRAFAEERFGIPELEAWDVAYYSEKLRQHRFGISQEDLRPYFPQDQVLSGMFEVVRRLYGITVAERDGIDTWHPEVRFFDVRDGSGELRGQFYLDQHARPNKRGGAWMGSCIGRMATAEGVVTPVAYLTCNFRAPVGADPALLSHSEVITLFHELGHTLHHLLTRVDYPSVAGIGGVPWDAVELPSQFLENWCWQAPALELLTRHYRTGDSLPDVLFQRMRAARSFQAGMQMVRQLEFGLFDFGLHLEYDPQQGGRIQERLDAVRDRLAVIKHPPFNRFQHSFAHIFAGGYAAGYYSYKWAEVLSSDAFSRFEETGIFNHETGLDFLQTVLEQGGARDPMELFVAFRGREPSIEPLLRHSGIRA